MSHPSTPANGNWWDSGRTGVSSHYLSSNQAITTGAAQVVDFDTEISNSLTRGEITTGASWRYTANQNVTVLATWGFLTPFQAWDYVNSFMQVRMYLNGTEVGTIARGHTGQTSLSTNVAGTASFAVVMSSGDYIDFRANHGDTVSRNIGGDEYTAVQITEL